MSNPNISVDRYDEDTRSVELDCPHSTTGVLFHRGTSHSIEFSDDVLALAATVRGLAETPCDCLNDLQTSLLAQGLAL